MEEGGGRLNCFISRNTGKNVSDAGNYKTRKSSPSFRRKNKDKSALGAKQLNKKKKELQTNMQIANEILYINYNRHMEVDLLN